MPGDAHDKRKEVREEVTLCVEYEGADDLVGDYTENLSSGGTFVATNRVLPVGQKIKLVLSFPGLLEPIAIEGFVRWTRGEPEGAGAGIEFEPGPARDQLAAMITRIRARDPKAMSRVFRMLVVEDNAHVAHLIMNGIKGSARREFGGGVTFDMRCAEDGQKALEILRQDTFDALIVDIYLPVLDGASVIQVARTELGLTNVPIIAVSAGGEAARRVALEAGANIFLDKPMRLRQVIDTIQKLVVVS
jgi:uncharacterized protein (TIGR02266 family)